MSKKIKFLMYTLVALISFLTGYEKTVHAVIASHQEDTQVGKASEDKERAIAVGKTLMGKVDYRSGVTLYDGHGSYDNFKRYKPGGNYGLDCSSFIAYIMMHGYGVTMGTRTQVTSMLVSNMPREYVLTIEPSEWKRGDFMVMNGGEHVIMVLGDGRYMASNGSGVLDKEGGPTISIWDGTPNEWNTYDGTVFRLPDNAEEAIEKYPDYFKKADTMSVDVDYTLGSDASATDKAKKFFGGDDAWKDPMIKFEDRQYVMNTKGLRDDQITKATPAVVTAFTNIAYKIWDASHAFVLVGGVVLFGYMSVLIIFYMAVLPRTQVSNGALNAFEKMSGTPAYYSKEGLLDLFSKLGITVVVIAILYANAIPMLFTGVYNIINYLL